VIFTRKIQAAMWALGMPTSDAKLANVYRAAVTAGLTDKQAFELTKLAYLASRRYEWEIDRGAQRLHRATLEAEAKDHPRGASAETLLAEAEGRPSRWGTPEFHRSAVHS